MTKTVADRLREITPDQVYCEADYIEYVLTGERKKCPGGCKDCFRSSIGRLADAIEAEQSERQLSEGIEWPRFEDGELVKFGDKFDHVEGYRNIPVERITFRADGWVDVSQRGGIYQPIRPGEHLKRPEPEVLDADGVKINEGDLLWETGAEDHRISNHAWRVVGLDKTKNTVCIAPENGGAVIHLKADMLTHRKPDTQEAINHDAALLVSESFFDQRRDEFEDRVFDLLKRQRKLLGGD